MNNEIDIIFAQRLGTIGLAPWNGEMEVVVGS